RRWPPVPHGFPPDRRGSRRSLPVPPPRFRARQPPDDQPPTRMGVVTDRKGTFTIVDDVARRQTHDHRPDRRDPRRRRQDHDPHTKPSRRGAVPKIDETGSMTRTGGGHLALPGTVAVLDVGLGAREALAVPGSGAVVAVFRRA